MFTFIVFAITPKSFRHQRHCWLPRIRCKAIIYCKDEKAQPCSPVPTESSLETLTNEDNYVKNYVEFVAGHHDSNSKKLYGKYDNGQTYFPDTRNTSFEESDDNNDQYDVKRDSRHIDHHQELSAKEISGEHENPQPCFPVRKETSLEGSNSDVGDNDDSKTNANFCERNIFDESGFPSDIVQSMCRARIPTTGLFQKTFDNRHFQIPISQSKLGEFPVITSKCETRFGGGWVAFLKKCLEKVNRYCVWVLKRNRLEGRLQKKIPRKFLYR